MIDYSKLKDPEYFKDVLSDIKEVTDANVLANLLKILSIKIANKEIDPIDANMLLSTIKNRNHVLTDARKQGKKTNNSNVIPFPNQNDNNGGRQLSLAPTAVSNRAGTVSIILIVAGVALTAVMYTLLWIANIIK